MSSYVTCETEIKDQECLIAALKDLGYDPVIHKEAQPLEGYRGDQREQRAHIILPRRQVGGSSNDVGFERLSNGTHRAHISEFDRGSHFSEARVNQLKAKYARRVVEKTARSRGYTLVSEKSEAGKLKLVLRRYS